MYNWEEDVKKAMRYMESAISSFETPWEKNQVGSIYLEDYQADRLEMVLQNLRESVSLASDMLR